MILKGYIARMHVNRGTASNPILVEVGGDTTMIETEEQGFLNTIRANPDDEAPRLVYADWLDENGQPERAWLIREGPALKWYRRRYGKWVWEREYPSCALSGEPFWGLFNDGEMWNRCTSAAYPLFPQTWRRHLSRVIYRRGFVSELYVDRFTNNVKRLLCYQPVTTITTSAEAMLNYILNFGSTACLRTIRLTTVPISVSMLSDGRRRDIRFGGVDDRIVVPFRGSDLVMAPEASLVEFYIRRVIEHYLTPHGITVQLPPIQ